MPSAVVPRVRPAPPHVDASAGPRLLTGDRALITGAASGIGRELGLQLAAEGVSLALIDRDPRGLAEVAAAARELGVRVETRVLDVADLETLRTAVSSLIVELGGVELCAPLAGLAVSAEWAGLPDHQLDLVFRVNALHAIVTVETCLNWARINQRPCHALLAGSDSVLHSTASMGPYSSAKAALTVFALSLARQLEHEPGLGVTLGLIFATQSGLGRSSASYLESPRARFSDRWWIPPGNSPADTKRATDRLNELDDYLEQHGDAPDVVVARLVDAVRRGELVVNTEHRPSPRRRIGYALAPVIRQLLPRTLAALTTPPRRSPPRRR